MPSKVQKLTKCLRDLLITQDDYRTIAYCSWLWHDLLDILDLLAPEDQDWLDNISSEDESEEIIKAIV